MKTKLVILGAGESGTGAAVLAIKQGFEVFVSDFGSISAGYKRLLQKYKIEFEENKHSTEKILEAEKIIKSPGIPDNAPIIQKAVKKKIPVISEIEFASEYTNAKIIAITGSNGKTTTTLLTHHILKNAGFNVGLAGNVGKSFALQVALYNFDYYVLEISSFQLDGIITFKPDTAVLLNITADHLDRYENKMQNYINSKFRITENLNPNNNLIYCADDPVLEKELKKRNLKAAMLPFSIKKEVAKGAYKKLEKLIIHMDNNNFETDLNSLSITGDHNVYNSMAAGIVARLNEVRSKTLRKAMSNFENAAHRMEKFISVGGIKFINDSKATNINSTWYALQSMTTDVVLIIGGTDKGNDYNVIKDLVKEKVKALVCLGEDNKAIFDAFVGTSELYESTDMYDAVKKAHELADEGDTVLLSPACASFDRFKNYEDRGDQYKLAVRAL